LPVDVLFGTPLFRSVAWNSGRSSLPVCFLFPKENAQQSRQKQLCTSHVVIQENIIEVFLAVV
jgi:hypothetical protein